MEKILSYPVSVIYYLFFGLSLLIFHPIQWICLKFFGYQAHKKSVDYLNFALLSCTRIAGTRYSFKNREIIPTGVTLNIVTNQQSKYNNIGLIWYRCRLHTKFIS